MESDRPTRSTGGCHPWLGSRLPARPARPWPTGFGRPTPPTPPGPPAAPPPPPGPPPQAGREPAEDLAGVGRRRPRSCWLLQRLLEFGDDRRPDQAALQGRLQPPLRQPPAAGPGLLVPEGPVHGGSPQRS